MITKWQGTSTSGVGDVSGSAVALQPMRAAKGFRTGNPALPHMVATETCSGCLWGCESGSTFRAQREGDISKREEQTPKWLGEQN